MRLPKSIEHYDDERDCGNGIIITIKAGYRWSIDDHGLHVRGYETPAEARAEFRDIVKCNCDLCMAD